MDKELEHIIHVCKTTGVYEGYMHYIHAKETKFVKRSLLSQILWPGRESQKEVHGGLWCVQRYEDAVSLPYDDSMADFEDLRYAAVYFQSLENEERKNRKEFEDGQTEGKQEQAEG